LIQISRLVFDHFDGYNFVVPHILAFDDLTKCALTKNVKDEISDDQF